MTCLEKDQFIPVNVLCFGAKQLSKRRPKPRNRYVSSRYSSAIYETHLLFLLVELPNLHHDFGHVPWLDPKRLEPPQQMLVWKVCCSPFQQKKHLIFRFQPLVFSGGFN